MITPELMRKRSEALVVALVGKPLAPRWWCLPNHAFDMQAPRDVELEHVYNYLMGHASGSYS